MQTLFFTLIAFVAIIVLMSVGFIFQKTKLKGQLWRLSSPLVLPKPVIAINLATRFKQN